MQPVGFIWACWTIAGLHLASPPLHIVLLARPNCPLAQGRSKAPEETDQQRPCLIRSVLSVVLNAALKCCPNNTGRSRIEWNGGTISIRLRERWLQVSVKELLVLFKCVVSGLCSSEMLVWSLIVRESAKARLGGTIEQSLLKQISSLRPNQCGILVFPKLCPMLCLLLCQKSSQAFDLGNLQVTTPLLLPMLAFLESFCPHRPTSSYWSLWWIEGPMGEKRSWSVSSPSGIAHLLYITQLVRDLELTAWSWPDCLSMLIWKFIH